MSKFCTNCGASMEEGAMFCAQCGAPAKTSGQAAPAAAFQQPAQPVYQQPAQPMYQQPAIAKKSGKKAGIIILIIIVILGICGAAAAMIYNNYNSPESQLMRAREAVQQTSVYSYKGCSVTAQAELSGSDGTYKYDDLKVNPFCADNMRICIKVYSKGEKNYDRNLFLDYIYLHNVNEDLAVRSGNDKDETVKVTQYYTGVNIYYCCRSIKTDEKRYVVELECSEDVKDIYEKYFDKWIDTVKIN